jgi:hypothetical protein
MTTKQIKDRLETLIVDKSKEDSDNHTVEFLQSLKKGLLTYGQLTEKQSRALDRIEKLATPEAKKEAEEWIKAYSLEHRDEAIVCARYYLANPPYFSSLAKDIINNNRFVPTKSQFEALCQNNYAKKVLKEYYRKPKFEKGDLVQVREGTNIPFHLSSIKSKICMVVDNNHNFITTHASGAKTYRLLPIGRTTTLLCQERWLKNFRVSKKKENQK